MWSSKISNAVGSRTPGLTRDTLREELQLFAKDSFREELDLLKRELEESFQQRLEIFRHELEAFFQTWAYELVRSKSSKQSFVDVLSDSHGAFRERKSNRGGTSSTALADNPSDSPAKKISRHSQRIFSSKTRFAKEVTPHSELDSDEGAPVMATSSLTTGWMNRHRRSSGYGSIINDGQATGSTIERHISSASFRRSQANSSAMPQSWMYRPRRSSGTSAELKDLIHEYRMSEQEKKTVHSTGDIVAAIVKPFQRSNMAWLKRHADSYRQLQLTQETVLKAVCPTESPAASYSLIPAPIEVDRRSALSSSSLLSQDIEMGGSLSSTTVANFAGAGDSGQPADKPKPIRRTFTWAGGNDEDGLLGGGGLDDIDDVGAAIKSMKSHKTNNNAASSGAKPSLKRGFTMNRGQTKSVVENNSSQSQAASRRSNRRGSDDGFATDHFQHHHHNTSVPTAHHLLECQRHSGNSMYQAFPEGSHETNHHGDSHEHRRYSQELLPFSEDVVLSESNRESESEGGLEYGEVILVERLAELINSPTFTYVLTSMILVNSLIFGFETDWKAQNWSTSTPLGFSICDYLFCTLFVFEIGLRICVYGCAFFSVRWNVFDFTVVSLQLAHQVLSGAAESDNVSNVEQIVPVLLMARLFRIFRAASMAHLFSELRMLIISIVDSLKSICWAMILLVVVTYVSSVYFTQVVTIHKVRHGLGDMEQAQSLEMHYGSLSKSMISLFECVSNGISWHEVMDPLIQLSGPFMTIVFVFYITFTMFVVLNVITGIFVETATQKANEDKKKVLMLKLKEFFHHADSDGSGTMTWEKFERQLEIPEQPTCVGSLGPHGTA